MSERALSLAIPAHRVRFSQWGIGFPHMLNGSEVYWVVPHKYVLQATVEGQTAHIIIDAFFLDHQTRRLIA